MSSAYRPTDVMPKALADVVENVPFWFVIGGQAVRCFCPYRPSQDVDFGVESEAALTELVDTLARTGATEMQERSADTVHLLWNGIKVSVFTLPLLVPHVEDRHLSVVGLLATKMHAILDRGLRRDFFDLYVLLQQQRLGVAAVLAAIGQVYRHDVDDALLLRGLTYFADADREMALPGEGKRDWAAVKAYFLEQAGRLLLPPRRPLSMQAHAVDIER